MEDRYLFKAKHFKKWHIGNIVKEPDGLYIRDIKENVMTYINDESTICQCTGLKDKNGNLIWENDILMCYDNTDNLVKVAYGEFDVIDADSLNVSDSVIGWHHEVVSMDALNKYELLRYDMLPLTEYYIQLMESKRIGNIFDNPELLESEE
jgi:uncharacterized phage protein (TIGR01671 family)